MAVMSSKQYFRLVHVKFLLINQNVTTIKLSLRSLIGKFLVDFKARKLPQHGHFSFYCPLMGGYFSSVDLEMGVRVRLREVPTHMG